LKLLLPALVVLSFLIPQPAWAMTYVGVTPSDSRANQTTGVAHFVTFKASVSIGTVDGLKVDFGTATGWFPTTGTCSAFGASKDGGINWPYTVASLPGSLTCSVNASGLVTIGGITTGLNSTTVYGVRIQGSTAVFGTPAAGGYGVTVKTLVGAAEQESQAARVVILGETQVSGSATVPVLNEGTVTFSGFGAPSALVTILDGGTVVGTTVVLGDSSWMKTITFVTGDHSVSLYQEDSLGRRSSTIGFLIHVNAGSSQSFSNIYFSPTIALSATVIKQGDPLDISGFAQAVATVTQTTNSDPIISSTTSGSNGSYLISLVGSQTSTLDVGAHSSSDIATNGSLTSPNSQVLGFSVTSACSGADLNKDHRVNLTDLSILLFYWHTSAAGNPCADINKDGTVNLVDFSIMLYQWTG